MYPSVLLITFNRPDNTLRVLESILSAKPKELFVFQDGPRESNDTDIVKCGEVRKIIEDKKAFSDTDIYTNYSDTNLGCGRGPSSAISWFFENVEEGIIFEDDCIPHPDFFSYCCELLEKYRLDERIAFIGGCNYGYTFETDESYCFASGHHQTWGWATWKRSWSLFDYDLEGLTNNSFQRIVSNYYQSLRQREYWCNIFDLVKKDKMGGTCWDYQFYFSMWSKSMLAIYPRTNLVINIGTDEDATHTQNGNDRLFLSETHKIMPLVHPDRVTHNYKIDDFMMRNIIIPQEYGSEGVKRILHRINKRVKKIVGHQGPWIKRK